MRGLFRGVLALGMLASSALAKEPPAPVVELRPDAESFDDRHRPEAAPWIKKPLALEAQLGLGAPLGLAGAALDVSPSPGFSLNFGAGVGHSTRSLQLAGVARMRIIAAHGFAVGPEAGLAMGRYEEHIDCPDGHCPPEWHWNRAVWGNVGLFLERRSDTGLALRWSFGAASIFNLASAECLRCRATDEPSMWQSTAAYTMLAVGWAFRP